jgi:drug/metabolite transporter (DMT)-like permease
MPFSQLPQSISSQEYRSLPLECPLPSTFDYCFMANRALALTMLVLLMLVWGTTYISVKSVILETTPLMLACLRFFCASAVLVPLALMRGSFKALPKPLPIGTLLLMTLCGYVLYFVAFNYALVYTSAVQGALIQALLPAAVAAAAAIFLRERLSARRIIGIALSIAGVMLVVRYGQGDTNARNPVLGGILMASTVVFWAIYTVLAKRLAKADQIAMTAFSTFIAGVLLVPLVFIDLHGAPIPPLSTTAWAHVAYLGLFASGAAFVVYNLALRDLDASAVGVWMNLVPIVGMAAAVLFLGETLNPWQIVGGAVALIGMWLSS